jgi:hypothetical protein
MMSFAPLSVQATLIRDVLAPDLTLTIGRELMVRVAATGPNGNGSISLAGVLLDATLPATAKAGDELRLIVRDISADRVLLQIDPEQAAPPPLALALGAAETATNARLLQLQERPGSGAGPTGTPRQTLALVYNAPTAGSIELRFVLDGSGLHLALTVPPGAPFELASASAEQLAAKLTEAAGRAATVRVRPRREPLEVFA